MRCARIVRSASGICSRAATQQRRCFSDKAAPAAPSGPDVLINSVSNGATTAHVITLNRPKALNALNLNMIRTMYPEYRKWIADDRTSMVIMKGSGDKAFCAGGDIRAIYDAGRMPGADKSIMKTFFHEEYNLNYIIGCFNKPHIAILNGITMGGGVGLSVHGSVRIATENSVFAMPETGIGFFPDVGGSFFLPRLQNRGRDDRYFWPVNPVGLYLALTGARLKGPELYLAGIATNYVEAARLPELEKELVNTKFNDEAEIYDLIESYNSLKLPQIWEDKTMKSYLNPVMDAFGYASLTKYGVEDRINLLLRENNAPEWAKSTIKILQSVSPVSLKVTNELMQRGAGLSLDDCLRMEFALTQNFMKNHDFFEGVRAAIVDKDKNPKWTPAKLEEVTEEMVESYFEAETELVLPDDLEQQTIK